MKKNNNNIPLNYKEKSFSRISFLCSVIVLAVLLLLFYEIDYVTIRRPAIEAGEAAKKAQEEQETAAREPVVTTATIVAVGNTSFSGSIIDSGIRESEDWNYDHLFANVRQKTESADLAFIGQESTMTTDHETAMYDEVTPAEVGTAMADAGFDAVAASTNHVMDNGSDYIRETLSFWQNHHPDVKILGVHDTSSGDSRIQTFVINDITISVLNYSYGMVREGGQQGYRVDTLNTTAVASDLQTARENSDFVIVLPHWGNELESMPTEYEKEWAAFFLEHGVDVVIGSHPYVLQPYGRLSDDSGNEMVIFYSLGNFITSRQSLSQVLGGMAEFTLEKTVSENGTTLRVVSPRLEPLVMHYSDSTESYGSYLLSDYTSDLANAHSIQDSSEFSVDLLKEEFEKVMSMNVAPSEKTTYMDLFFDTAGSMTDQYGNPVDDTESVTASDYFQQAGQSS